MAVIPSSAGSWHHGAHGLPHLPFPRVMAYDLRASETQMPVSQSRRGGRAGLCGADRADSYRPVGPPVRTPDQSAKRQSGKALARCSHHGLAAAAAAEAP